MHSKQKTKHQHEDIQIETNQTKLSIERFRLIHGNIMILIFTLAYEILHATKNLTFFTPLYT